MSEIIKRRGAYLPHWTQDGGWVLKDWKWVGLTETGRHILGMN